MKFIIYTCLLSLYLTCFTMNTSHQMALNSLAQTTHSPVTPPHGQHSIQVSHPTSVSLISHSSPKTSVEELKKLLENHQEYYVSLEQVNFREEYPTLFKAFQKNFQLQEAVASQKNCHIPYLLMHFHQKYTDTQK